MINIAFLLRGTQVLLGTVDFQHITAVSCSGHVTKTRDIAYLNHTNLVGGSIFTVPQITQTE